MKNRAYRYLPIAILGFALLVVLPGLAAAGESPAQLPWLASLTKAACHGTVSCQPNYPSCASWSGYSDCGDPWCGALRGCGDCEYIEGHLFCYTGPAWKQPQESFRVCFDQWGNSCTEWLYNLNVSCECP